MTGNVRDLLCLILFLFHSLIPPRELRPPRSRGFTITFRHTTLGRSPLDEWSARRRDLYTRKHTTLSKDRHSCLRRDSNPQFY